MNPKGGEQSTHAESATPNPEQFAFDAENHVETPVSTPETSANSSPGLAAPPVAPVVIPDTPTPVISIASDDGNVSISVVQSSEKDRIDKQWVERAKTVAAQTKSDPFRQKSEMSRVKADYIEKRFNKKIKLDDAMA